MQAYLCQFFVIFYHLRSFSFIFAARHMCFHSTRCNKTNGNSNVGFLWIFCVRYLFRWCLGTRVKNMKGCAKTVAFFGVHSSTRSKHRWSPHHHAHMANNCFLALLLKASCGTMALGVWPDMIRIIFRTCKVVLELQSYGKTKQVVFQPAFRCPSRALGKQIHNRCKVRKERGLVICDTQWAIHRSSFFQVLVSW